jgi:hypothetical protein
MGAVSFGVDTLAEGGKFVVAIVALLASGGSVCLCTAVAWPLTAGRTSGSGV